MPLLSFVIPAYNAAPYLAGCLDSIFSLPMQAAEYEVVAVDDGSTDDTWAILTRYAAAHPSMKLARQPNRGLSATRNRAIPMAVGDYIYFVDADDRLRPDAPFPLDAMRSGRYDIITLEAVRQDADGRIRPYGRQRHPHGREFAAGLDYLRHRNLQAPVFLYLFRRDFIVGAGLTFHVGLRHEDEEFTPLAFAAARRCLCTPALTYIYITRANSITNHADTAWRQSLMLDLLTVIGVLADAGRRDPALADALATKMTYLAVDTVRQLVRRQHAPAFVDTVTTRLRDARLYPIPRLREWRVTALSMLTATPQAIKWWILHPRLARIAGF